MEITDALIYVGAGLLAGIINTLAGSGSMFTLPALVLTGFPADLANGTNRVGILFQTFTGSVTLLKHAGVAFRKYIWMLLPAILGALAGAMIAVKISETILKTAMGVVMLGLLVLTLFRFENLLKSRQPEGISGNRVVTVLLLFIIGMYGGFIQAGVGILLLSLLLLYVKMDYTSANTIKNSINFFLTIPAFMVFTYAGLIDWRTGAVIACGQVAGAWLAARYSLKGKNALNYIRYLLVGMMALTAWTLLF